MFIGQYNAYVMLLCYYFGQKKLKSESAAECAAGQCLHVNWIFKLFCWAFADRKMFAECFAGKLNTFWMFYSENVLLMVF